MLGNLGLLGQAALGSLGAYAQNHGQQLGSLGYVTSPGQEAQANPQDMAAAQRAALQQEWETASVRQQVACLEKELPSKTSKQKYSKFKKCGNPIKQSEFTYRG